jgi:hypothetical protein
MAVKRLASLHKMKEKLYLLLTKHHAIKAYWASGGIVPRTIILALDGGGQLHVLTVLLPQKQPQLPI